MRNRKIIVFFFPWEEVSGGPYYLIRMANELAKDDAYEVYYTDYKKALTDKLRSDRVKKLVYSDSFELDIKKPITLITPIYWAYRIPFMNPRSKILFFNWHYCCIPVLQNCWGINQSDMHNFLSLVQKNDACFFGDYTHWLGQNTKDIIFNRRYVPIVIPKRDMQADGEIVEQGIVNIGLLGRLVVDKVYSMIDVINHIPKRHQFKKIRIHVIGDGPEKKLLEALALPHDTEIEFAGTLSQKQLTKYLSKKVDVLFAMGTSALEAAVLHIPTVIIPHNVKSFNSGEYVYLHNCRDYALGWYNTQMSELDLKTISVEQILSDIYKENRKQEIGDLDYIYCSKNHFENISHLKKALDGTRLRFDRFLEVTKSFLILKKRITFFNRSVMKFYVSSDRANIVVVLLKNIKLFSYDRVNRIARILGIRAPHIHCYGWEYGEMVMFGKIPVLVFRTHV